MGFRCDLKIKRSRHRHRIIALSFISTSISDQHNATQSKFLNCSCTSRSSIVFRIYCIRLTYMYIVSWSTTDSTASGWKLFMPLSIDFLHLYYSLYYTCGSMHIHNHLYSPHTLLLYIHCRSADRTSIYAHIFSLSVHIWIKFLSQYHQIQLLSWYHFTN